jgi:antirestriction protein ArdC
MKKQYTDVYQLITDRIVAQLESGTVPWRKPWAEAGHPRNHLTGRHYSGINVWLLASLGYPRNRYLTFNQARDAGATVKKGEKGHLVVFWKRTVVSQDANSEEEARDLFLLRHYYVFNVDQCEGLPETAKVADHEPNRGSEIAACEELVDGMPKCPRILHEAQRAFYSPSLDLVNMPKWETFSTPESYYGTLFHELVHSTGHSNRLARSEVTEPNAMGSAAYSREELVAEIGACYLNSVTGIAEALFGNSVAYIGHWLEALKSDKRLIVVASSRAQKAADYILNADRRDPAEEASAEEIIETR